MDNITISMEEYKELLIIKGRYEELKETGITNGKHQYVEHEKWFTPDLYRAECTD
jgi:hypothetical protein